MPAVTASKSTCPTSCPLQANGCYAEAGPLAILWNEVTRGARGIAFAELCKKVRRLPRQQIWRYGQAGDLPGAGDAIDGDHLARLAAANARRPAIVFTHKPPASSNLECLRAAVDHGLHINLSADGSREADDLSTSGLSVVTVLPSQYGRKLSESLTAYRVRTRALPRHTPGGLRIAVCPATYTDVSCAECQVCARPRPNATVIEFPAHGTRSRAVDELFLL